MTWPDLISVFINYDFQFLYAFTKKGTNTIAIAIKKNPSTTIGISLLSI
jgi:hypothetical protein